MALRLSAVACRSRIHLSNASVATATLCNPPHGDGAAAYACVRNAMLKRQLASEQATGGAKRRVN